jgi:phage terminase Nu1 subunit (DNA packaging protein)
MTPEQQYCRSLIESAATPDDLKAALELFQELKTQPAPVKASGPAEWSFRTLGEVAAFFGVSVQAVKQWRMETPPMPGDEGRYPCREIVMWREARLQRKESIDERRQQEIELTRIKLERERMDLAERRNEVVPLEEVERWAGVALTECRQGVMQLPGKIAASTEPAMREEVRAEVTRHCEAVLEATFRRLDAAELGKEWNPDADNV